MRLLGKAHWESLAIGTVVLTGAVIRCWQIRFTFDGDEIFSVMLASDGFVQTIARSLADTPHPPLHNILLYAWMTLFGGSELAVRALSVLFSCGFIFFVYRIMRRYSDAWVSLGISLLAALSPLFVYYGQQTRPYSLIALMSAANLYTFLKALDAPTEKWPIRIWALTGVGLLYSQYLGVLFIGLQIIWVVLERKEARWRFVMYGAAVVASLGLWASAAMGVSLLQGTNPVHQIRWIAKPTPTEFAWFYVSIFGERFATRWLFAILAVLVFAYGRAIYRTRRIPKEHRLLLLLAFGLPLIAYAVSIWGPKPVFVSRQLVGAALTMLVVTGLLAMELPTWAARAFLCILVGWSAMSFQMSQPNVVNPPWREASQWIDQTYGPELLVAEESFSRVGPAFYRSKGKVLLWKDVNQADRQGSFLFACRPAFCKTKTQELAARTTPVKTWHWNRYAGNTPFNQLTLYQVRAKPRAVPHDIEARSAVPGTSVE